MIPYSPAAPSSQTVAALAVVGVTIAVSLGTLAYSATGAAQAMPPVAATSPSMLSVTLITGDVVVVHDVGGGHQAVDVRRPHGAVGGVRTETIGKDLYVFPGRGAAVPGRR